MADSLHSHLNCGLEKSHLPSTEPAGKSGDIQPRSRQSRRNHFTCHPNHPHEFLNLWDIQQETFPQNRLAGRQQTPY